MVDFVLAIFQNVIAMVPYDWYKTKFARRSYHSSPHQVKASFLDRLNGPERGNPYIKGETALYTKVSFAVCLWQAHPLLHKSQAHTSFFHSRDILKELSEQR